MIRRGHRYGAVLVIVLGIALFALTAPEGRLVRTIELLSAGAALMLAVLTSRAPRRTRRIAGTAIAVSVIAAAIASGAAHPTAAIPLGATAVLLAATAVIILAGLGRLVLERGVVLQAVLGAVAVYVLVGLTFGFVVGTLADVGTSAYFAQGGDGTENDRVYFSFTVLTTTGFGDFTAATRAGRALAVLEMLIGQLYLVTVIAMLVGNLRRRS